MLGLRDLWYCREVRGGERQIKGVGNFERKRKAQISSRLVHSQSDSGEVSRVVALCLQPLAKRLLAGEIPGDVSTKLGRAGQRWREMGEGIQSPGAHVMGGKEAVILLLTPP